MIIYLRKIFEDSLIKNSIYLMMTNFSSLVLGFFFWVIATRYYSPNDIGIISAVISCIFIISMISSMGFPTALIFYLPRDTKNANRIISSCMIIVIAISILLSLIFFLGLNFWMKGLISVFGDIKVSIIFFMITIMTSISALMGGIFMASKRSEFHMAKEATFDFIKIFPLVLFPGFGALGILISWSIGLILSIIIAAILLYNLRRYTPILTVDPIIKTIIKFSGGNYITNILYNLPRLILPIMIVDLISVESSAYFFISITVAGLLYGISQSTSFSLLAQPSEGEKLLNNVIKMIRFNLFLLIPGFLLFVFFGKFVLSLFNPTYAEHATATLIILAAASIPLSLNTIFSTVRNSQKRVMSMIKVNGAITGMTLIFSMPLMKMAGIEGAAISYLVANTIVAMVIFYKMKDPIEFMMKLYNG